MARRFVVGDIHGAHKAMIQCFEKSGFKAGEDFLICLGDICDGWPEVNKVFDELIRIRNLVLLLGNHDNWALDWFLTGDAPYLWLIQGGEATIGSFKKGVFPEYIHLLENAQLYFETDNKLFVHGGFQIDQPIENQGKEILIWDRSLIHQAMQLKELGKETRITGYNEVFVGHTPTINFNSLSPIKACEVWLMDTGAGWPSGVLSMMDIDSGEIYSSSLVKELYPDFKGRGM